MPADVTTYNNNPQPEVSLLPLKNGLHSAVAGMCGVTAGASELDSPKPALALEDKADLKKQLDLQNKELYSVRFELDRVKSFLQKPAPGKCSGHWVADDVNGALQEMEKGTEGHRGDLATSRNNAPQKPREALPRKKATILSDRSDVRASQYEGATDADKMQNQMRELQLEVTTTTAKFTELQDRYAAQSQEFVSLGNQLHTLTQSNQEKDRVISSITLERDVQMSANASKADQIANLQHKLSDSTSKLTDLQDRYRVLADELSSISSKLQTSMSPSDDKEHQVTVLMDEIKRLKSDLSGILDRLRDVQRIISTADLYADETVISMLKRLNAEVQQNTTYMAEVLAKDFRPQERATEEQVSAMRKASSIIGKGLADCLAHIKRDDVELYLPIAFQAYFSRYLRYIISSWTIEKANNSFIDEIYDELQKAEAQAMSGRWRALTRSYIPSTWIKNPSSLIEHVVDELSGVVVAAGCAASASVARSKLSSFRDKVLSIISVAGQLSEMIGKVVSADLAVIAPSPLEAFEEATMEQDVDDYDKNHTKTDVTVSGQNVLCPTYMGMTKRMQREPGKKETLTVIKAKVVLESFLDG